MGSTLDDRGEALKLLEDSADPEINLPHLKALGVYKHPCPLYRFAEPSQCAALCCGNPHKATSWLLSINRPEDVYDFKRQLQAKNN